MKRIILIVMMVVSPLLPGVVFCDCEPENPARNPCQSTVGKLWAW